MGAAWVEWSWQILPSRLLCGICGPCLVAFCLVMKSRQRLLCMRDWRMAHESSIDRSRSRNFAGSRRRPAPRAPRCGSRISTTRGNVPRAPDASLATANVGARRARAGQRRDITPAAAPTPHPLTAAAARRGQGQGEATAGGGRRDRRALSLRLGLHARGLLVRPPARPRDRRRPPPHLGAGRGPARQRRRCGRPCAPNPPPASCNRLTVAVDGRRGAV